MTEKLAADDTWKRAVSYNRLGLEKKRRVEDAVAKLGEKASAEARVGAAVQAVDSCKKRRSIPKTLKDEVWIAHFGTDTAVGHCVVCSVRVRKTDFQLGHKISRANGGPDTKGNLTVLCPPCNQSQGTEDLDAFKSRVGPTPVCGTCADTPTNKFAVALQQLEALESHAEAQPRRSSTMELLLAREQKKVGMKQTRALLTDLISLRRREADLSIVDKYISSATTSRLG